MKKYIGMNFRKWCKLDEDDERKINYKLICSENGNTEYFTSEDYMDYEYLAILRNSTINDVVLKNNEWFIELIY